MSRTLHLFGTDWCAMMVPIQVIRWYRMQCYDGTDSCAIVVPIRRYCHEVFSKCKIVCPQRSKTNTFGYNECEWYAASDVFFLTNPKEGYDLKYLLGLLNSKLYFMWLYSKGKRKGETLELTATPLSEIPIKKCGDREMASIVLLVDSIISAKKQGKDTSALENQIDFLVYHLYGLTYDEVLIVDTETPISREEYEAYKEK